jgi:Holliday junction resolvasome RuvABC endonuclease subunit
MKVLGLDLATSTGYAVVEDGAVVTSGTHIFPKKRGESNGIMFLRLRKFLQELIDKHKPGLIAYERAHFRGAGTELLLGFQVQTQTIAEENKIESFPLHTGTIKKRFAGHGKASKKEMMEMCELMAGVIPGTDDEADAIAVAYVAVEELGL